MNTSQTRVVNLLEANGFEMGFQLTPKAFESEPGDYCVVEKYLGWEIHIKPVFALVHVASGRVWLTQFKGNKNVKRAKELIRAGIEGDLAKAVEVKE